MLCFVGDTEKKQLSKNVFKEVMICRLSKTWKSEWKRFALSESPDPVHDLLLCCLTIFQPCRAQISPERTQKIFVKMSITKGDGLRHRGVYYCLCNFWDLWFISVSCREIWSETKTEFKFDALITGLWFPIVLYDMMFTENVPIKKKIDHHCLSVNQIQIIK